MISKNIWNNKNLVKILENNGVVVMPTDTIYGIAGKAEDESVVSRIYAIRKRNPDKPCIILIGDIVELEKFSVVLSEAQREKLKEHWPISAIADIGHNRAVSIVLDCNNDRFSYLHRGTNTLAFRAPTSQGLRDLLMKVGPLIAPSANTEALPPSQNIAEAKKYFGNAIDLYVDGGSIAGKASKVIKLHKDGSVVILRK